MDKQLQRLIDLSNKTGDRLIVFDPVNPGQAYVVMPIGDYEKIAVGQSEVRGLTEDELLDKINRDIAIWKSDKDEERSFERPKISFYDDMTQSDEEMASQDDWRSFDEIARESGRKAQPSQFGGRRKSAWRIPSQRKERAEEIIEEDRFYLEDVED